MLQPLKKTNEKCLYKLNLTPNKSKCNVYINKIYEEVSNSR